MRCLPLAALLSLSAAAIAAADSTHASLRVGVEVTRSCTVSAGGTTEVQCTRMPDAAAQPRVLSSSPAPGPSTTTSATAAGTRIVTVLF